jgi:hypothetical protein
VGEAGPYGTEFDAFHAANSPTRLGLPKASQPSRDLSLANALLIAGSNILSVGGLGAQTPSRRILFLGSLKDCALRYAETGEI